MSAYSRDTFELPSVTEVLLDLYTSEYRVSGKVTTRFTRVADIVNQVTSTHLPLQHATISEYDDPGATLGAENVHVPLDEVLLCIVSTEAEARPEMRIAKRQVKAQIAIPPFRLTGTVHVPPGSRPVDGLLNAADRFLPMTEVNITCARHPQLGRAASALAVQRRRAHVLLVADDERPDELIAEVLDERTAHDWLMSREPRTES